MVRVRTATEQDGPAISAIYAPYVRDTAISFEEMPPTPSEMSERARATFPTHPFLVFQDSYGAIAYSCASRPLVRSAYLWSVDVGFHVSPVVTQPPIAPPLPTRAPSLL